MSYSSIDEGEVADYEEAGIVITIKYGNYIRTPISSFTWNKIWGFECLNY